MYQYTCDSKYGRFANILVQDLRSAAPCLQANVLIRSQVAGSRQGRQTADTLHLKNGDR